MRTIEERISSEYGLRVADGWKQKIATTLKKWTQDSDSRHVTPIREGLLDSKLLRQIVGNLTIEESFFFRHGKHYPRIAQLISSKLQKSDTEVRIWSAGCAAGQEPYSVAIALHRILGQTALDSVNILGTDVNEQALQRARSGVYTSWSFRGVDPMLTKRYFVQVDESSFQLSPEIRKHVQFQNMSIQEVLRANRTAQFDVIIFRNVAIYLTADAIKQTYEAFAEALKWDGALYVGPADPRPTVTRLLPDAAGDTTIFHKKMDDTLPPPARSSRFITVELLPAQRIKRVTAPIPPFSITPLPLSVSEFWENVRQHADRGNYAEAETLCNALLKQQPTAKEGYLLRGIIRVSTADDTLAVDDFRRALFFDPRDVIVRYWYALALYNTGRPEDALKQIQTLIQQLNDTDNMSISNDRDSNTCNTVDLMQAALALKGLLE